MKKLLLLSFLFVGCAHQTPCNINAENKVLAKSPLVEVDGSSRSVREMFPRAKKAQSEELFTLLKKAGAPEQKMGETIKLVAYDVSCQVDMASAGEKTICEAFQGPKNQKPNKRYILGNPDSEKLRDLLFSLPVSQGDSGAATEYVSCYQFLVGGKKDTQCSVAIELDYPGP